MTVTVPEGELGGVRIERFTVEEDSPGRAYLALRGRGIPPGTYTRLFGDGTLWMSDTPSEKRDHLEPLHRISSSKAERILLNGLGLGMVLQAALTFDHVKRIDVVEKDERIVKLIGPHYMKDPRVVIHHADAYEQTKKWPAGTRWDAGWSDIWADVSTDDLTDMARLNRSYGRRCSWHGCWGQDILKYSRYR
ncbi:hypothetical protein [Streptomyces sp. 5-10]|uniref:hypothetical protein n=1 Tax=Streptomyces sp. 5-10 TaxID=878925 RepID=UPI00168AEB9F|nr:hypothetical protein [Streptomyces sp. 5-10]MBD3004648.1 hypothetical protein [Streptomyces sp. 5-10]